MPPPTCLPLEEIRILHVLDMLNRREAHAMTILGVIAPDEPGGSRSALARTTAIYVVDGATAVTGMRRRVTHAPRMLFDDMA